MSHFGSKLFGGLGDLLGESEVAWPFRLCNQAIAKSQTALSATSALIASDKVFTRSRQFLSDVRQNLARGHQVVHANFGSALARACRITAESAIVDGTIPFTFNYEL